MLSSTSASTAEIYHMPCLRFLSSSDITDTIRFMVQTNRGHRFVVVDLPLLRGGIIGHRFQTTHLTSGGAVTAVSANCCANCADTHRPQQWMPDLPCFFTSPPCGPAGILGLLLKKGGRCLQTSSSDNHTQISVDSRYLPQGDIDKVCSRSLDLRQRVAGSKLARTCELALRWCASKRWVSCRD